MNQRVAAIWSPVWRAAIVLLSVEIAVLSLMKYFTGGVEAPPPVLANPYADPFLPIHVVSGVAALLAGPVQFVRRLRERRPAWHRHSGRLYVAACAIAAPSGLVLSMGTFGGPVAGTGFGLMAVLLGGFTWLGVRAAAARRIAEHREWMLRGYALLAGAITLRLMLPASGVLGFDFVSSYQAIAWLSWTANLAAAEYHIRRTRTPRPGFAKLAAA